MAYGEEGREDAQGELLSIEDALAMYETYKMFWEDNYREANIDLKMAAGDAATHWGKAYQGRVNNKKSVMVINELPQFIHQVNNDIRQNTPSIETLPSSDGDIETADAISDLVRGIEYQSSADEAYDTAGEYAVKCAIGFISVDHDYISDDSDDQELKICKEADPLTILIDPGSVECDGRDMMGAIKLEPINKKEFQRLYKGKKFCSFIDPKNEHLKDSIVLANIYIKEISGKHGKTITIRRYKFSGEERLDQTTFPGEYVPIVPVIGEDVWIDGKRILSSLIRQARDPQLRLNHWACKEQEILNKAPIAPVMAVQGTLVNERRQWQNPDSEMVLEYKQKDLDGNPAPAPDRLQPATIPTGIINAMEGAKQNIKESLGMYNASIGERSNETSGVAIQRRQHEGDVATFHFPDNVRRSITQVGRILVSAASTVYDTPRVVQTMNKEMKPKMLGINGAPLQEGQKRPYDLTKGKYHVRVTTGASYTTKRQEASAVLSDIFKQDPELMKIGGDLLFDNMDLPGMKALADRVRKTIPPELRDDQDQAPPDPEKIKMAQALKEMQAKIAQLGAALEEKNTQNNFKRAELFLQDKKLDIQAREVDLKYPPQNDTLENILEHHLDEQSADNELRRDLISQVAGAALQQPQQPPVQPQQAPQGSLMN